MTVSYAPIFATLDEADIVVAHNAKKFDNRVAAARFMYHGFLPPSPFKTVDTPLAARRSPASPATASMTYARC